MALVTFEEVSARLAVPLDEAQQAQVEQLIGDAIEQITVAFQKAGRDWSAELKTVPWLEAESKRVIREMVTAAVVVGPNLGLTNVSSTTGQESDSAGFSAGAQSLVSFGGVRLTDQQKIDLGLLVGVRPRGCFPPPIRWPERRHRG